MFQDYSISPLGDNSIIVQFESIISKKVNSRVHELRKIIQKLDISGVVEIVPAYCSLQIIYNPLQILYSEISESISSIINSVENIEKFDKEIVTIPVIYGGESGFDLDYVASRNNLTPKEVIAIHTSVDYLVYMIGFTPGFPYLGPVSPKIAIPRMESPRGLIKAGSVGIAGNQSGIYPIDSPGGWRIIGWTPIKMFDPQNSHPVFLKAGQYVRFKEITKKEYDENIELGNMLQKFA